MKYEIEQQHCQKPVAMHQKPWWLKKTYTKIEGIVTPGNEEISSKLQI